MTSIPRKSVTGKSRGRASASSPSNDHRERILRAALAILTKSGRDALTTRGVAEAARVQPPILYRLFHDKTGLLNAVAEYGFVTYLARKRAPETTEDPVESLRSGWRRHVDFGLHNPELYRLMYAEPHSGSESQAAQRSHRMLQDHMRRVAVAGRLRVSEERATHLFHAAAFGIVMTLLAMPPDQRDMSLSAVACEAALMSMITDQPAIPSATVATAATKLRGLIMETESRNSSNADLLTEAERCLLVEWLRRLADGFR